MAFNDIIPSSVIHNILDSMPIQYHLPLECPPIYTIKPEYFCSINQDFSWIDSKGCKSGILASHVDHPAFAALRNHLEGRGYIETQRTCGNGDRVLKPFYLNGKYFERGDKFLSASAMAVKFST